MCAFEYASTCMELTRAFIQKAGGDVVAQVRTILLSGVTTSRHADDDVSRLFARALDHALEFITHSPDGSLLMNAVAYEDLGDTADSVELFDKAEHLYVFAWQALQEEAEPAEPSASDETAAGEEVVSKGEIEESESEATVTESEQADVDTDVSTEEEKL